MAAKRTVQTTQGTISGRPVPYVDDRRNREPGEASACAAGLLVHEGDIHNESAASTRRQSGAKGDEPPTARLRTLGSEALSAQELVALVLAGGRPGRAASALAEKLFQRFGSLRGLGVRTLGELMTERGMGLPRAAALAAAFEIGRRVAETRLSPGARLGGSADVFRHYHLRLRDLKRERFLALLLDGKHRLAGEVLVSEGTLTASPVHPREAFVTAVRESAAALIFVHNHPSGDPAPSSEDADLTRRLVSAGELLGIKVLDHVVIGDGRCYSFADMGRL